MGESGGQVEHGLITIRTMRHVETGLLVAISDEMKGLYVHARSEMDLWERIPIAIHAILEADGYDVSRSDIVMRKLPRSTSNVDPL